MTPAAFPAYNRRMNTNPCIDGHKASPYWKYDARGIPLAKVCNECAAHKLSKFRADVLSNGNYQADEAIEPDWRENWRNSEDYDYSDVYDF